MTSGQINMELFCKFPKIDFNSLELKPNTNFKFCSPQNLVYKENKPDLRYVENDSRYITPEDREKYEQEFIQMKRERERKEEEFMKSQFTLHHENQFDDYQDERELDVVEVNELEEDDDGESEEEFYDEYEFRTGHKKNKM